MFAQGPWADKHNNNWFVIRAIPEQSNVQKALVRGRGGGNRPLMPRLLDIVYLADVDLKVTEIDSSWEVSVPRCFWNYKLHPITIVVSDDVDDKVFFEMDMTPLTQKAINATKKLLSAPPPPAADKNVPKVVPRVAPQPAAQVPDATPLPPSPSSATDKDKVKAIVKQWALTNHIVYPPLIQAIIDMASTPRDFALLEKGDLEGFIPDKTPFFQKKATKMHWDKLKVVEPTMGHMNSESSSTAASLGDKKTRPFDSNCLPREAAIKKWFLPKFSTDVENTAKDVAIVLVINDPDDGCIKRIQNNPKVVGVCLRQIYGSTKNKIHPHVGFIVREWGDVQDSVREKFLETFFEALSDGKSLYDAFAMAKSSAKCVSSKFTNDWKHFEIEIHAYPKKWAHIFEA